MITFEKGKRVRVVSPLPESAKPYASHVANQRGGLVCVMQTEDEIVGSYCIWVTPAEYMVNLSQFWVFPDWIEEEEKQCCTCDIYTLMNRGCKCGEMQRERERNVQER